MRSIAAATQHLHGEGALGGAGAGATMPNIQELAMSVMNQTSEHDLEEFAATMPQMIENLGGIENIMQMATAMQGQLGQMFGDNPQMQQVCLQTRLSARRASALFHAFVV